MAVDGCDSEIYRMNESGKRPSCPGLAVLNCASNRLMMNPGCSFEGTAVVGFLVKSQ